MSARRTPGPYDRNLLAGAPTPDIGSGRNYDVRLLHTHPPPPTTIGVSASKMEVSESTTGTHPTPVLVPTSPPFWGTKAGKIVIGVVVAVVLIIALVGGSLGAAAAASVHHQQHSSSSVPISGLSSLTKSLSSVQTSSSVSSSSSSFTALPIGSAAPSETNTPTAPSITGSV